MPLRVSRSKKSRQARTERDSLYSQVVTAQTPGVLSTKSLEEAHPSAVEDPEMLPAKISQKIVSLGQEQQTELENESENYSNSVGDLVKTLSNIETPEEDIVVEEGDDYDVDLSLKEEEMLNMFRTSSNIGGRSLADMILAKIHQHETQNARQRTNAPQKPQLPAKVVTVYRQVGVYLSHYKSGPIPKAFKVIPQLSNWEEILFLTEPHKWSKQAVYCASHHFASNLHTRMAEKFYSFVILPHVRKDIERNKRLNYHLYMALKKCLFKPAAFFKGIILPLVEEDCTPREAVILSSILKKMSIPVLHSGAALMKLCSLEYSGPCVLFIKSLLNKKYALPSRVVQCVCRYFTDFLHDDRDFPVLWHQTLLVFVERYKDALSDDQKAEIRHLTKVHKHHLISPAVKRELNGLCHM